MRLTRRPLRRRPGPPAGPTLTALARGSLLPPLLGGMLLLSATLCLDAAHYRGLHAAGRPPPLPLAAAGLPPAEDEAPTEPDAPAAAGIEGGDRRELPVRVVALESRGGRPTPADPARQWATQGRVAVNLLLRSGYLDSASADVLGGDPPVTAYRLRPLPEVLNCAHAGLSLPQPADDAAVARLMHAAHLAISAVAVEKFHRTGLQRRLEWWWARAWSALTGDLPDLSLGPAQIRPSTLSSLLVRMPPGGRTPAAWAADPVGTLADECAALGVAAALIHHQLSAPRDGPGSPTEAALMAYAGQRRPTHAVIDYAPIVARMADLLQEPFGP
ncbi:hypothetical protein [Aquabacterium sp. J223]|uniref:hypothetical protein n=1 Tax=Aquabacterium sp. J223 TaxID=2898431 RepID=UPI0021AD5D93|nr:hypothetical protein [Aquabacterium sp. J223]UUX95094.1 hypothetical protein LRS07_17915 [Aquabacterium sp. J223]